MTTYADNTLNYAPDFEATRDRRGVWSGRQVMWCKKELALSLAPAAGTAHPDYPFLFVDTVSISNQEQSAISEITATYIGADYTGPDPTVLAVEPEYALDVTLSEDPLETHPRYADALSVSDINEVVRLVKNPKTDDNNVPVDPDTGSWDPLKIELFDKLRGGFENYRNAGATWTAKEFYKALPNLNDIGTITAAAGPAPGLASGRNWLQVGFRARIRAGGEFWEVERSWEMSGRGGWDSTIYA